MVDYLLPDPFNVRRGRFRRELNMPWDELCGPLRPDYEDAEVEGEM